MAGWAGCGGHRPGRRGALPRQEGRPRPHPAGGTALHAGLRLSWRQSGLGAKDEMRRDIRVDSRRPSRMRPGLAVRARACGAPLRQLSAGPPPHLSMRSEEHTSELQSLMRNSYAVFCLKKKNKTQTINNDMLNKQTQITTTQYA